MAQKNPQKCLLTEVLMTMDREKIINYIIKTFFSNKSFCHSHPSNQLFPI